MVRNLLVLLANIDTLLFSKDNYAHRASVRKALSQDKEWLETYVKEAFPCIDKQSNVTLSLLPWMPFNGGSGDGTQPRGKFGI